MANPQTENGFARIANEILEGIQMYKFTLNELKIIMCIWRFTYGFSRKSHQMSLTFIMKHTGLNRSRVNNSLKNLLENKVLLLVCKGDAKTSNSYSFNKDYEAWNIEKYSQFDTGEQNDTSVQIDTRGSVQDDTSTSVQIDTRGSVQDDTQERKVKESIKKKEDEEQRKHTDPVLDLLIKNEIVHPASINYTLMNDLNDITDNFGFDNPDELIIEAIKDAARGNGRTWKFVYNKLDLWRKQGVKNTVDLEKQKANINNRSSSKKGNVDFDDLRKELGDE